MAQEQIRDIALISIHPEFTNLILGGEKKVEFRKVCFARDVSHIVIYSTAPISRIVAYCEVQAVVSQHPLRLWDKYSSISGIDRQRFFEYYAGYNLGVAIELGQVIPLYSPLKISSLSFPITPPQSYLYLQPQWFEEIQTSSSLIVA
jgi:predicted transcriptional regulator